MQRKNVVEEQKKWMEKGNEDPREPVRQASMAWRI